MSKTLGVTCARHKERPATNEILIEGGHIVATCDECRQQLLMRTRYVCKYCGSPIKAKNDYTPMGGSFHTLDCPRSPYYIENSDVD